MPRCRARLIHVPGKSIISLGSVLIDNGIEVRKKANSVANSRRQFHLSVDYQLARPCIMFVSLLAFM